MDGKGQENPCLTTAVAARPCVWHPKPARAPVGDGREDVLAQHAWAPPRGRRRGTVDVFVYFGCAPERFALLRPRRNSRKGAEGNRGVETFRVAFSVDRRMLLLGGLAAKRQVDVGSHGDGERSLASQVHDSRNIDDQMSMTKQLASGGILRLGVEYVVTLQTGTRGIVRVCASNRLLRRQRRARHGPEAWPSRGARQRQDGGRRLCCEAKLGSSHGGQRSWQVCFWVKHVCLRHICCGTQGQQLAGGGSWQNGFGIGLD